ncbi:hypothetical protein SH139x_003064 [Planctomycetaceae bacterium SH139]
MTSTVQAGEQRTLLRNIAWQTFLDLCEQREGSVPRMTYDRGELELMSPRRQHEELGCFIGRIVDRRGKDRDRATAAMPPNS